MTKTIFSTLIFFLSIAAFANKGEAMRRQSYFSISDLGLDSTISSSEIRIKGMVSVDNKENYKALVSTDSRADEVWINEKGNYEMVINPPTNMPMLVCKTAGYKELVIKGRSFKLGHVYQIDWKFYKTKKPNGNYTVKKPVIYLYSDSKKDVTLELLPKAELSFTYPELEEGWSCSVDPDGIHFENGKTYPYLFWEAENATLQFAVEEDNISGFLVPGDDIIPFFESQLGSIGLNNKEITDFITFWGPSMVKNELNLIQFLVDDDYEEKIAALSVYPELESTKRLFMLFSAITAEQSKELNIIEQEFNYYDRKSYNLLEWGGSELQYNREL